MGTNKARIISVETSWPRDIHEARRRRDDLHAEIRDLEHAARYEGNRAAAPLLEAKRTELQGIEEYIREEQGRREEEGQRARAETHRSPFDLPDELRARGGGLWRALERAGWSLRSQPAVTVSLREALPPSYPDPATWAPEQLPGVQALGRDTRFLWPFLRQQSADGITSISDFRQTGNRTVTGDIERDLGATTPGKATLGITIEHINEPLKTFATIIEAVPNALLESLDGAAAFFNSEATYAINQALDGHVFAQIAAANPPTGKTGSNLIEQVRHGVSAMRAVGSNPRLLVVSPEDAAALDLAKQPGQDATPYIFPSRQSGTASPLWGLTLVEATNATTPMLVDPERLGVVYLGAMAFLADPFTGFKANTTSLRFELNALAHIRSADAVYVIAEPTGDGDGDGDGDGA